IFSFPPCTAHFLFDVSKRKWGVHPRPAKPGIPRAPRQGRNSRAAKRHTPVPAPWADIQRILRRESKFSIFVYENPKSRDPMQEPI
ncbi:hypothetical protein, partial [Oscillibacter valericigenes]|uniref:hypothetical protein n=1 Tax=Oscillibacter valericigenes TaxID=351091 RepID=UPI001F21C5BE